MISGEITSVFQSILSGRGITAPIDNLEIVGVMDTPGLHWSNPGVKQISVYAGSECHRFVMKRLAEHSKREIPVYRFLSEQEGFPIPRLYHDVYDDDTKEYWMVIERCIGRDSPSPSDFFEQCGILLARIHASFWDGTDALPDFFHARRENISLSQAVDRISGFLESLSKQDRNNLSTTLGISIDDLYSSAQGVNRERLPEFAEKDRCLIHGSFHSPEIMWSEESGAPVGVDWEECRTGHPAEDLSFGVQTILAKGEVDLFDGFINTYLSELSEHEIKLDRDEIIASVLHEARIKLISRVLPFVLGTYLKVHDDESYTEWLKWFRQDVPETVRFIQNEIESSRIYDEY